MSSEYQEKSNASDSETSELVSKLGTLAMEWRGQPENRRILKQEYHQAMARLYILGWDEILDFDYELPDQEMPEEYKRRHPYTPSTKKWPSSWGGQ